MKIEVTQADIDAANNHRKSRSLHYFATQHCAIVQAVQREHPQFSRISVNSYRVGYSIDAGEQEGYRTTAKMRVFMGRFDSGRNVLPTTFSLIKRWTL